MLRRSAIATAVLLALMAVSTTSVAAAKPLQPAYGGQFKLRGSHGYLISAFFSNYKGGSLTLIASNRGGQAVYDARGEVTPTHVGVDLGALGKVDVEIHQTGETERVRPKCGRGEAISLPATELIGTIEFHGEEDFTTASATHVRLDPRPLAFLGCPVGVRSQATGEGLPGAQLNVARQGGPRLTLSANSRRARVRYEAEVNEREGEMQVVRFLNGYLGGGHFTYSPSLDRARFVGGAPFAGSATYRETRPPRKFAPGRGTWRGNLTADFPGRTNVPLAGNGLSASIIHAEFTR